MIKPVEKWINGDWEYTIDAIDGTAIITSYIGSEERIAVPGSIDGIVVQEIGERALAGNHVIEKVTIGEGIVTICKQAFIDCFNLKEVSMPDSLREIGPSAFGRCFSINDVVIPKNVSEIKNCAFSHCINLTNIRIAGNIRKIGKDAFSPSSLSYNDYWDVEREEILNISGFKGSYVEKYVEKSGSWNKVAFSPILDEKQELEQDNNSETFDDAPLKGIVFYAFGSLDYFPKREKLTAEIEALGGILKRQFSRKVDFVINGHGPGTLNDSVTEYHQKPVIREQEFTLKIAVERLNYPGTLTESQKNYYIDYLKKNSVDILKLCIDKKDLNTILRIHDFRVIKGKDIDEILEYANARQATEIAAYLLEYRNSMSDNMEDLQAESDEMELSLDEEEESEEEVITSTEKTKSSAKVLRGHTENTNSVSDLNRLWSYKTLENGTLEITSYDGKEEEVEVPAVIGKAKVSVIGENAFSGSEHIRNRNDSRRVIHKIVIPEGIDIIEKNAFYKCKSLTTIVLPSTLKRIEYRAFGDCNKLTDINIPKYAHIGINIFKECDKLHNSDCLAIIDGVLYSYSAPVDRMGTIFRANIGLAPVEVKTTIVIPDGVSRIADFVFKKYAKKELKSIEQVILPESVEEIGESAFADFYSLKQINIPSGIKEIKRNTFKHTGIKEINLPGGLQKIGDDAFAHTKLAEVFIPDTVTAIGKRAFYECTELKDIYIPASVVEFGDYLLGVSDGVCVHTPAGSDAEEYMKQYNGVHVVNDYPEE